MFCLRAAALLLLFGITLGSHAPYYDLADAEQHFADFINKYEKKYESVVEFRQRFDIFKRNLNKLNEWNAQYKHENGGYVITQFSDKEGCRSCVDLSQMSNTTSRHQVKKEYILNSPITLDYRDQNFVTEVKNQGDCESAGYIFSAIGNMEGVLSMKKGQLISLSEQQALDCTDATCKGGLPINIMRTMGVHGGGIGNMAEGDYPYTGVKGLCNAVPNNIKVKMNYGFEMDTPDVATMKGALAGNGSPLSVCVTDSPLCRACMEEEETAAHVILACPGVAEYRAKHLGTPGSLPEAVGNVKGLLGFLVELGWHE